MLQVGTARWSGLGEVTLSLPGLAQYPSVAGPDLLLALPLALAVAAITVLARFCALQLDARARQAPLGWLLGGGALVGLSAVGASAATGSPADLVLFAGQSSLSSYVALTSAGTACVLVAAKFVAHMVSLGSGFRGGALFPAIAIGVLLASATALVVPGSAVPALAAVAIAAAVASGMRMPFTAVLLGSLLTAAAGPATTVLAIVGAVTGLLLRLAAESRVPALSVQPAD